MKPLGQIKKFQSYESQLRYSLLFEISELLNTLSTKPSIKSKILQILQDNIDNDNILKIYTHEPRTILYNLLNGTLSELYSYTSCQTINK